VAVLGKIVAVEMDHVAVNDGIDTTTPQGSTWMAAVTSLQGYKEAARRQMDRAGQLSRPRVRHRCWEAKNQSRNDLLSPTCASGWCGLQMIAKTASNLSGMGCGREARDGERGELTPKYIDIVVALLSGTGQPWVASTQRRAVAAVPRTTIGTRLAVAGTVSLNRQRIYGTVPASLLRPSAQTARSSGFPIGVARDRLRSNPANI
jgi:hypothetical protein